MANDIDNLNGNLCMDVLHYAAKRRSVEFPEFEIDALRTRAENKF